MKLLILLFLFINVMAQDNYSVRISHGRASEKNLGDIIIGDFSSHSKVLRVTSLEVGHILYRDFYDLPIDIYLKGGLSYFDESGAKNKDDVYEGLFSIKAYYNFFDKGARFGFAEGISYVNNYLYAEESEAMRENDHYSKLLNYLDISLDFSIGKLIDNKTLYGAYFGYALKHRSGVAGLYNGVRGGSNYNTLYLELNF